MSSNKGHNPAANDPAVIYWDWEGKNTLTRPPPGAERPSKDLKYPPELGPTGQSPWDKPYFQRPGSRSRAGTLRRADATVGGQRPQPDADPQQPTVSNEAHKQPEKEAPSGAPPNPPETLYSEVKRKAFEEMGIKFIDSLQKSDKTNAGNTADFSPILEGHWNELAEFYSEIISTARIMKNEPNPTNLADTKESPAETHQPSSSRTFHPLDKQVLKSHSNPMGKLLKTNSTPSTPKPCTDHPTMEGAFGSTKRISEGSGASDQFDTTISAVSGGEESIDTTADDVASMKSIQMNKHFENVLSEAMRSVKIKLKPLEATWDEHQILDNGNYKVSRNTEGSALYADTQIEFESLEMIRQGNSRAITESTRSRELETIATSNDHQNNYIENAQDPPSTPLTAGSAKLGVYSNHFSEENTYPDTGFGIPIKHTKPEDSCKCIVSTSDTGSNTTGSKISEGGAINKPKLSHTNEKLSGLDIEEDISSDCSSCDVSGDDSLRGTICGSTPEEIGPKEVNYTITTIPTNTSMTNLNQRSLGLNMVESDDPFSTSEESSTPPSPAHYGLEKSQTEVANHLDKVKTEGGPFTTKWIDQFGIKGGNDNEVIKSGSEPGMDQNASIYYDIEGSSEYEDKISDDMEQILAPMSALSIGEFESIKYAPNTDVSEGKTAIRANFEKQSFKNRKEGSSNAKKIEVKDSARLSDQTSTEPEKEFYTAKEEKDNQGFQEENVLDGENFELEIYQCHAGAQLEESIVFIKEIGKYGEEGDKMAGQHLEDEL